MFLYFWSVIWLNFCCKLTCVYTVNGFSAYMECIVAKLTCNRINQILHILLWIHCNFWITKKSTNMFILARIVPNPFTKAEYILLWLKFIRSFFTEFSQVARASSFSAIKRIRVEWKSRVYIRIYIYTESLARIYIKYSARRNQVARALYTILYFSR